MIVALIIESQSILWYVRVSTISNGGSPYDGHPWVVADGRRDGGTAVHAGISSDVFSGRHFSLP